MGIDIPQVARMDCLIRRAPMGPYMTREFHARMHKAEDCINCGACAARCPYGLDTPSLIQKMLRDYDEMYALYGGK